MSAIQKIKGFADLFPEDSRAFTRMEDAARDIFGRYGFGELRIPVLERTELFAKGIGEDTDVVGKEMYTFTDRGGRSLTMRPEATAGALRAAIEAGAVEPGKATRLYAFGPMFRYERPQKGRMRQFHQIDAELLGSPEPHADVEVILMLRDYLEELGIGELAFELNSLGCRNCRPDYRAALTAYFEKLDAQQLCEDCRRRMHTNPLRVLDCKVPGCKALVADAPAIGQHLCGDCRSHFDAVLRLLDSSGLAYALNPRLVRGLDYYQRTTFEVTSGAIGAQTAVAGGGRYDGLVQLLGGPDAPGVGFACGMERLAMLMEKPEAKRPDFFLAVTDAREGGGAVDAAVLLAHKLRARQLVGECDYSAGSMKSRLRHAGRIKARKCYIIGPEEFDSGTVTIKDMDGGGQIQIERAAFD
ncbi:histidyl-tRNA synthetase [Humidesulfovibrio mexicanus]|uniref:Histidine--tRNA ligase n=1 Tax=Humidesulfovibrio mexicanus TaxID=147047 RepID=A0A239BSA2_9BACT|nr:histidine--tRNA ligase [Humidesulfovibrio mexicanus]SNS10291.1 histidyl-tRNA synthetase [Humidesulfovibrio mexicanus]